MKDGFVKVAAAAPQVRVADLEFNTKRIIEDMSAAREQGVKVLCFPELCITGYSVGDLVLQQAVITGAKRCLAEIAEASKGMDMLVAVGLPWCECGKIFNCAAVVYDGHVLGIVPKTYMPTYSEFYELRNYEEALPYTKLVECCGETVPFGTKLLFSCRTLPQLTVACEICEDIWVAASPSVGHADAGATLILNLSASNEFVTKADYRADMVRVQSAKCSCAYLYCSAGETESTSDVVFSAHRIISQCGNVLDTARPFDGRRFSVADIDVLRIETGRCRSASVSRPEDRGYTRVVFDMPLTETALTTPVQPLVFVPADPRERDARSAEILAIQTVGLARRISHIGCKKLLLGISGGLDSTLALFVACLALDRLGRPHTDLIAVTMPCFGTTARTRSNAEKLCETLGVDFRTIDISEAVKVHLKDIGLKDGDYSVAYENAQARERTQVLMDMSNLYGGMVVGTGDLSEGALGFATYNGDHISMYNVNCSVPKTAIAGLLTYAAGLKGYTAAAETVADVIATPVSPELLPAKDGEQKQLTQDTTGPYELVDFFLYYMVRWGFLPAKIVRVAKHAFGEKYTREQLTGWLRVFYRRFFNNQFKRSCVPDGPKVGSVSLSPRGDWRMPSDACATLWLEQLDKMEGKQ